MNHVSNLKTSLPTIGDLIKLEYDNRYCREKVTIENAGEEDIVIANAMGYPVIDNGDGTADLCVGAEGSDSGATDIECNALLLIKGELTIAAGETINAMILRDGPVLVNKDVIPVTDYLEVGMELDDIVAGLKVSGIKVLNEPLQTSTQET